MAIAVDARTAGTGKAITTGADSITWSHTVAGSDRIIVVFVSIGAGTTGTVSSVTYNGTGLTQFGTVSLTTIGNGLDTVMRTYVFSLIAPATGANNVVVNTTTGAGGYVFGSAISLTGVHQTSPWNAAGPHTQNTANAQPSITVTSAADEWAVGGWTGVTNPAPTTTAGAGQTEIGDAYRGTDHFMYHVSTDEDSSGSSTVLDYTGLTLDAGWGVGGVAGSLVPVGGGGGGTVIPVLMNLYRQQRAG